jgi:hypothetical protein
MKKRRNAFDDLAVFIPTQETLVAVDLCVSQANGGLILIDYRESAISSFKDMFFR